MSEQQGSSTGRAAGVGAAVGLVVVVVALGAWLALRAADDAGAPGAPGASRALDGAPAVLPEGATVEAVAAEEMPAIRIEQHGRLTLVAAEIPADEPFVLGLDMPDEARRAAGLLVRIVSTDGRRLDTAATVLGPAGSGVKLEIAPAFLTRGMYMIEVETTDVHPLNLRRYVVDVR